MEFLATSNGLILAAVLLILAALMGFSLVITHKPPLPIERRRPGAPPSRTLLTKAADATSAGMGRLLEGRDGRLENALDVAGLTIAPRDFLILMGAGMFTLFALGLLLWGPIGALLLVLISPLLVWAYVQIMTSRRRKAFSNQLEETLQILAGSLRAGYSLSQAAATVATEAEQPTSQEFTRVINESRVGKPLVRAFEDVAARVRNEDFFWVIQAIAINREVGGNLAEVLDGVGHTIRERTQLRRQVDALASEGKISAIVLGGLPFAMAILLSVIRPEYLATFGESLLGILMLVVAGIMLVVGLLWLRVLVRIKF